VADRCTSFGSVTVEISGQLGLVTIDRPPVNALASATYREVADAFAVVAQSNADIAVLRAKGRHFCAGNDLTESESIAPDDVPAWLDGAKLAFRNIHLCPQPVIAAVHGAVYGAGIQLAGSCDLIVAAADARFALPEITVGMMGGARHLARLVPWAVVRKLFYTGKPVTAAVIAEYGGLAELVPVGEPVSDAAIVLGRKIAQSGGGAVRLAKRSLTTIEMMGLDEGYAFEASLTSQLVTTAPESREAMRRALASGGT
jgi:enoyl-CoA hydratase